MNINLFLSNRIFSSPCLSQSHKVASGLFFITFTAD